MVLADSCRDFMQVVATGVADADVDTLNAGFCLFPIVAEFDLAAHGLLCFTQGGFMLLDFTLRLDRYDPAKRRIARCCSPMGISSCLKA